MKLLIVFTLLLGLSYNKSYSQDMNSNNTSLLKKQLDSLSSVIVNLKIINNKIGLGKDIGNVVINGNSSINLNNTLFTNRSSISNTDTAIPSVFKSGFIQLLNSTGTITVNCIGGGSFILNSEFSLISFSASETKSYSGYTLVLSGGAKLQWNLNN